MDIVNPFKAFMPHGQCFLWQPDLLWLHVGSDAVIAFSYYLISGTLFYFLYKRNDLPFQGVFLLFGLFILACGTTHLMAMWTVWFPDYWERRHGEADNRRPFHLHRADFGSHLA